MSCWGAGVTRLGQPAPPAHRPETDESLLARIRPAGQWVGFVYSQPVDNVLCQPTDAPQAAQTGPFWVGKIAMQAILALWQEDKTGITRSHPFISSHRGSCYTLLWSRSPVTFPIHKLELWM